MRVTEKLSLVMPTGVLNLCDVRIGPTEDVVQINLGKGEYDLNCENTDRVLSFQIIKNGSVVDSKVKSGEFISIDGATLGIFDSCILEGRFSSDPEEFYHWGEETLQDHKIIEKVHDGLGEDSFVKLVTGVDGVFPINFLYQADVLIGIDIEFIEDQVISDNDEGMLRFDLNFTSTTVEVWIYQVYDRESIVDTILDALLDDAIDDIGCRISQIVDGEVEGNNESESISSIDPKFYNLDSISVFYIGKNEDVKSTKQLQLVEADDYINMSVGKVADIIESEIKILLGHP